MIKGDLIMITILSIANNEVTGWIMATDLPNAIQQARGNLNNVLVQDLEDIDAEELDSGKHILASGYTMIIR